MQHAESTGAGLPILKSMDFRRKAFLFAHSGFYLEPRLCEYQGRCSYCGIRTYAFRDGENDPRGPLGDRAASPLSASECGLVGGKCLPLCFDCRNDYDRVMAVRDRAIRQGIWRA